MNVVRINLTPPIKIYLNKIEIINLVGLIWTHQGKLELHLTAKALYMLFVQYDPTNIN